MNANPSLPRQHIIGPIGMACIALTLAMTARVHASQAWGSINNFDTVNDTGHECHGFEIELDDCHSTDITYTYNYNHYGVPEITEDNSVAGYPKVFIRWQSKKNLDGTWAAYTAIPAAPIQPTQGHQFTDPSVNFGGEHFGVGYTTQPSAVLYNWLIDNGSGTLTHGGAVQVSTPTFTYMAPAGGAPAQVQAVIAPPPPPAPPVLEFGKAVWMKEIKTTTHNANKVKLRELVSADPDHPEKKNWTNGEPDEVEVEWRILQKKISAADGGVNNKVPAAPEALPNGDEVVTRRYEFYKYVGPLDAETGEAMGDAVGVDGSHGTGTVTYADHFDGATGEWVTVTTDMSTKVVVGDFTGSQMAAVDVNEPLGLIDHVGDGAVSKAFAARQVVVEGALPFVATQTGTVPPGMTFDENTGILSGTPTAAGTYAFSVTASDGFNPDVAKNYTMTIAAVGAALPAACLLDTTASPVGSGTTTGDGSYAVGDNATVTATAGAGYLFQNWTDNGVIVSTDPTYTLTMDVNHSLVANFVPDVVQWNISASASPALGGTITGTGIADDGASVSLVATANAGYIFTNWTESGVVVSSAATYTFTASTDRTLVANFTASPTYTVSTAISPVNTGTATGAGSYTSGSNATVTATPNAGYVFSSWTVSGAVVSTTASYTFAVTANKALVANFVASGVAKLISTSSSPSAGGTTSGGGAYASGDTATVTATANAGYKFSKWKEGSNSVSSSPTYSFTVSNNRTLVATFTQSYSITASASPPAGGTTEMDSSSYKPGDTAQARATANAGYVFVNWTENGTEVSTNATYSFPATGNRVLVANFASTSAITITASAAPAQGGTVAGAGVYLPGDGVLASATANAGYIFSNWTSGGVIVSTSADYSFTASTSRTLVANFAPAVTVATTSAPSAAGSTWGGGSYAAGANATVTAAPNAGYAFVNWTDGGTQVSTSPTYTFTVSGSRTLTANFAAGCNITTSVAPGVGGTTTGDGGYLTGSSVTVSATAAGGYQFVNWTEAGVEVSTASDYTFTADADRSLVANFIVTTSLVKFDFDGAAPVVNAGDPLPLTQTVAGITAQFSSPNANAFHVGNATTTGYTLSGLTGNYLAPGTDASVLEITFDQLVSSVDANFALVETLALAGHSTLKLTAYDNSSGALVEVGNMNGHGVNQGTDTLAGGTLSFSSATPFNVVRIEYLTAAEAGSKFLIDNIEVSPAWNASGVTLSNPNWNITLSSFGYSDLLLDNTPGFEGREYLSGEWGAAVGYTKGGVVVSPTWLEPNFIYPDWTTNSTFHIIQPATVISTTNGLDTAQSVIANDDMEITIRWEMIDTVTGTPMGIAATSAGGAGQSIKSNRYILKQTYTVKNTSGVPISNVQFFQMLHGLNSQKGVYDNRTYTGPLSEYHYDVTLRGVDPSAIGVGGASSSGLEDFIGFHAMNAPTQFELGHYGIDTVDNHGVGKPSDGVHLSIEDNWLHTPFNTRAGTDSFDPTNYWIAGAQRWELGAIPSGQSVSQTVLLSILTGTKVTTTGGGGSGGSGGSGGCNGGSSKVGGLDYEFSKVDTGGDFFGDYSEASDSEINERIAEGEFSGFTFPEPSGKSQLWNLKFSGAYTGNINLTFAYNPNLLPAGFDESTLAIFHFKNGAWEKLTGTIDTVNHTITITTSSLSPFVLGVNQAAGNTVAYEQPPSDTSGAAYNSAINIPSGWSYEELRWDSFTLPTTQTIREIHWRGTYAGASPSAFEVKICPSIPAGIQPDVVAAPVASWTVNGNANQTPAGSVGGVTMYDYSFALPAGFTATAGVKYWLQIIAHQTSAPDWSWAQGTGGNSSHFARVPAVTGDWRFVYGTGDLAFALLTQTTSPAVISVSASPSSSGTVTGGGTYAPGASVTVTASPKAGKSFLNWSENGQLVSASASYTFTAVGNSSLVANFTGTTNSYTITAAAFPATAGTVGGAGTFAKSDTVTVDASPADGFTFTNWTERGVVVSTLATYSFPSSANRDLVANFLPAAGSSSRVVGTSQSPWDGGTTSGGGAFMVNQVVTLTASPAAGRTFLNWSKNGVFVSSNPTIYVTVAENTTYVANFSSPFIITANASAGGTATGGGSYASGGDAFLNATPNAGYCFVKWTEGGNTVSSWPGYAFTVNGSRTMQAVFAPLWTINTSASPPTGGTATGAGTHADGESVTVSAVAQTGYCFANWTEGGTVVGTSPNFAFTAGGNRSLVANFIADKTGTTFDFDTATPVVAVNDLVPFSQTQGSVTASFSSTVDGGFIVQDDTSLGVTLPKLSGQHLCSNGGGGALEIRFSQPVTSVSLSFATYDFQQVVTPSALQLTAFSDEAAATTVGTTTATGAFEAGDSLPTGRLIYTATQPFKMVRLQLQANPSNTADFLVDDVQVSHIPSVGLAPPAGGGGGNSFKLTWPSPSPGWVLQESTDLVNWTTSTLPIQQVNGNNEANVVPQGGQKFYRVAKP